LDLTKKNIDCMPFGDLHNTTNGGGDFRLNKENIDPNGSTDWLHRNYSYQHHKIDNDKVSIQMPAIFTIGVSLGV